jgi:signal transduction histidine kinase
LASLLVGIMPTFSPVFSVYACACTTITSIVVTKLFLLDDALYFNLGIFITVMGIIFIGIARDMNMNTSKGIHLQLEKSDLIAQLEQETENVRKAQKTAEQANQAKTKFLAAASHDIRQPIHALGLFLEVLDRSTLSAYQQQVLNNAKAAFSASADMLNTLLDFSRIEAGVVDVQKRQFYLQPLLNKLENEMAPLADNKSLLYRSRETQALVESDPVILELILRNLISNAIRYTNQGGILLGCRARDGHTSLEIWDTGIGISPDHHDDIFREFYQLGNSERDHRKGLGLGLAIVRGFTNNLGHTLSFSSIPGRGSVFRVQLPNALTLPEVDDSSQQSTEIQLLNARILLVDDDESVRQGMLDLLSSWGCECYAADSLDEALTHLRMHQPDLIISDYRLREEHTGNDVIRILRAHCGIELPALIITGDTAPDRLADAHKSGLPLLSKPVTPKILYSTLASMLRTT